MSEYATIKTAAPLTVTLDSSDTAIPALPVGSYAPVVDDRVVVDQIGGLMIVLGRVLL